MRTAIDSNLLSALFGLEPTSDLLVELLGRCRQKGALVIYGTVFAEGHAIPKMTLVFHEEFLSDTDVSVDQAASREDWNADGVAFGEYAVRRRAKATAIPNASWPTLSSALTHSRLAIGC
jgi:hypothetical protein